MSYTMLGESWRTLKKHSTRALDYLGKKFQLDIYYFMRGGFWLFSSQLLAGLAAFLVVLAFSNLMTKAFYGQYQFVMTILAIVTLFSLPGMGIAIIQSVSRKRYASLIQATHARLRWSILGSVALLVLTAYLRYVRPNDIWPIFLTAALFFPFLHSFDGMGPFFMGQKKFDKAAFYSLLPQIVTSLAVLLMVVVYPVLFWILFVYFSVLVAVKYILYRRITGRKLKGKDPKVVHYGWHLSIMNSIQTIGGHIDKLAIPFFLGFEQLAVYSIAMILPDTCKRFVKAVSPLLLPKFSALKGSRVYGQIKGKLLLIFSLSIIGGILGIVLAPFVVPLLFSDTYVKAVPYAQLLFASVLFVIPTRVFVTLLHARKKVKALYQYQVTISILSIILVLTLTPLYGIWGVCISRLITRYATIARLWWSVRST